MYFTFNIKIINEMAKIIEDMIKTIKNIITYEEKYDIEAYYKEREKLNLLLKKENIILNTLPKNIETLNIIKNIIMSYDNYTLDDNKNIAYVKQRISSDINSIIINLNQDDNNTEIIERCITENLITEYLKSFKNAFAICNSNEIKIYRKIIYYNIFINKIACTNYTNNDFDIEKMEIIAKKKICQKYDLTDEEYKEFQYSTILSFSNSLIDSMTKIKLPKKNIIVLDFYLNFKFLISKIATKDLLEMKTEIFNTKFKKSFIQKDILKFTEKEISKREDINTKQQKTEPIDTYLLDKLINLIKFEEKLYEEFEKLSFDNISSIDSFANYLLIEKDLISQIKTNDETFLKTVNQALNDIWIFLKDDTDIERKSIMIKQRITSILPSYNAFFSPAFLTESNYNHIYRNYTVKNIRDFYNIMLSINDETIKTYFKSLYKNAFFIYPFLTEELVTQKGNHILIKPLNDTNKSEQDTSNLEYNYDKEYELYNLSINTIDYLAQQENDINTLSDYANFQYYIIAFINAAKEINIETLTKLKKYINQNFTTFSPLRKDLIKIIKTNMKIKTK